MELVLINGEKQDVQRGFILCGRDDACVGYDGFCNPKYH